MKVIKNAEVQTPFSGVTRHLGLTWCGKEKEQDFLNLSLLTL